MTKDELKIAKLAYSDIFNRADRLFKQYNPCQFINGQCRRNRERDAYHAKNGCCSDCDYLGPNGCTTECLRCKLYVCHYEDVDPEFYNQIRELHKEVVKRQIPMEMRRSKDYCFRNL